MDDPSLREFAVSQLGEEAHTMPIDKLLKKLEKLALAESWSPDRGSYIDQCVQCGWNGQHATVGPDWHITKDGRYFVHPTRREKRPNFYWSPEHHGWICLRCVGHIFPSHPDSKALPSPQPRE